jgi:hypothetical protein
VAAAAADAQTWLRRVDGTERLSTVLLRLPANNSIANLLERLFLMVCHRFRLRGWMKGQHVLDGSMG